MAMLHIYRENGKHRTEIADGKGTVSKTGTFEVELTKIYVTVKSGIDYHIRQGQSVDGPLYRCSKVDGNTATFELAARDALSEDGRRAALALRSALLASEKSVTIEVAPGDLEALKKAGYRLCFAKKVGNAAYNVVWQSYSQYLVTNDFGWTPQYQLFGTNRFSDGIRVKVSTNLVSIGLGQQSTLNNFGLLGPASDGGVATGITMINDFGSIHPGVMQLSTGIDGSQVATPIYVAQGPIVSGVAELTPIEKVLVWFEQDVETSTMFSNAQSKSVEIDLTFVEQATRLYKDGKWTTPGLDIDEASEQVRAGSNGSRSFAHAPAPVA
jgi:hypothetical protein